MERGRLTLVRPERTGDEAAISRVIAAAFGQEGEAELVLRLREAGALAASLVAVEGERVTGHVALSRITVGGTGRGDARLGLAPLAVAPDRQRQGVGAALMREALAAADGLGAGLVVVLGEPGYYGRFGFAPGSRYGLAAPFEVPGEAFMARVTGEAPPAGVVGYHPAFAVVA